MRRVHALLLLPLLFVGGCAAGDETTGDEPAGPPPFTPALTYAADDVVLRVEMVGGYPDAFRAAWLPVITVYGDGRVVTDEPTQAWPPYALPNLLVRTVDADAVKALARLAIDAGVGWQPDYTPPMEQVTSTRFTVLTDEGPRASMLYEHFEQDLLRHQPSLADLRGQLGDLPTTLDGFDVGEQKPYEPGVLAAVNRPWGDQSPAGGGEPQAARAWPGPALPGGPAGGGLSCLTVTGDDLAAVLARASDVRRPTPWVWDGNGYEVRFRPLLPDEASCADLLS